MQGGRNTLRFNRKRGCFNSTDMLAAFAATSSLCVMIGQTAPSFTAAAANYLNKPLCKGTEHYTGLR
jgi:hypothetical protein